MGAKVVKSSVSYTVIMTRYNSGCKESQFYSLPFPQAVASIRTQKAFQLATPQKLSTSRIDYSSSVI